MAINYYLTFQAIKCKDYYRYVYVRLKYYLK